MLIKSADVIVIAGLVVILVKSLSLDSQPKIIAGSTFYHSLTNYRDSARNYLGTFRDRSKITFDENSLSADFKRDYPEVNAVSVELPVFSSKPVIRLSIAGPAFFLKSGDKEYVVDSDGRAVGPKSLYQRAKLAEVIDSAGLPVSLGKQVLSTANVLFITDLINQSKKSGVPIKSLVLSDTPQELDLRTTDQPYMVKFYLSGDPKDQIGQFLAARNDFKQKNIRPDQYLDVRVSGRIFYK
ncbi:MAG TPA: hypothetical protein VFP35_04180 [Candidatus Saccharimonadales bacterium]|nr:hypothetical protein [Candidatus Saccharimonadales bacterium]